MKRNQHRSISHCAGKYPKQCFSSVVQSRPHHFLLQHIVGWVFQAYAPAGRRGLWLYQLQSHAAGSRFARPWWCWCEVSIRYTCPHILSYDVDIFKRIEPPPAAPPRGACFASLLHVTRTVDRGRPDASPAVLAIPAHDIRLMDEFISLNIRYSKGKMSRWWLAMRRGQGAARGNFVVCCCSYSPILLFDIIFSVYNCIHTVI